jgi:hypothetical protein
MHKVVNAVYEVSTFVLSACLSVYLPSCVPSCLSACLLVCLPVCLSARLSACLSACLAYLASFASNNPAIRCSGKHFMTNIRTILAQQCADESKKFQPLDSNSNLFVGDGSTARSPSRPLPCVGALGHVLLYTSHLLPFCLLSADSVCCLSSPVRCLLSVVCRPPPDLWLTLCDLDPSPLSQHPSMYMYLTLFCFGVLVPSSHRPPALLLSCHLLSAICCLL